MSKKRPFIHIVVISNKPAHPVLQLMKQDAATLGWIDFTVLGEDQPDMKIGLEHGYGMKVLLMDEHLRSLPSDDIVLFMDAHDVRILGTPEEVLHRFLKQETRILIAAEKNCYPTPEAARYYKCYSDRSIIYKYVNSGAYIGYVGALQDFIRKGIEHVRIETLDQDTFTGLFLRYQTNSAFVKLDHQCELFQCIFMAHDDIDLTTLTNRVTKTRPVVWHGNGGNDEGDVIFNKICKVKVQTPT